VGGTISKPQAAQANLVTGMLIQPPLLTHCRHQRHKLCGVAVKQSFRVQCRHLLQEQVQEQVQVQVQVQAETGTQIRMHM
jgi:hypothetical protein